MVGVSKHLCGAELSIRANTQTRLLKLFAGLYWNPDKKVPIKTKSVYYDIDITLIKSRCSRKITDDLLTYGECFRPLCHFYDFKWPLERPHTKWMYLLLGKNYPHSSSECDQWSAKHKFMSNYLQFPISSPHFDLNYRCLPVRGAETRPHYLRQGIKIANRKLCDWLQYSQFANCLLLSAVQVK